MTNPDIVTSFPMFLEYDCSKSMLMRCMAGNDERVNLKAGSAFYIISELSWVARGESVVGIFAAAQTTNNEVI